jgi:hypothetical protein
MTINHNPLPSPIRFYRNWHRNNILLLLRLLTRWRTKPINLHFFGAEFWLEKLLQSRVWSIPSNLVGNPVWVAVHCNCRCLASC